LTTLIKKSKIKKKDGVNMEILKYNNISIKSHIETDLLLAAISFDGKKCLVGTSEDCFEHHILLENFGNDSRDIDKYFRITFDDKEANWTFVCPPDYKGIKDKQRRINAFYSDGLAAIGDFLQQIGLYISIQIAPRYNRHYKYMLEE